MMQMPSARELHPEFSEGDSISLETLTDCKFGEMMPLEGLVRMICFYSIYVSLQLCNDSTHVIILVDDDASLELIV